MRPRAPSVALLLFGSGFCALTYEVAWLRMLRPVFGASTSASAAVLAIFLGGLGFGGIVPGRRADQARYPLRLYAYLEAGVSAAAAVSPVLIMLVRRLSIALGGTPSLGLAGGTALRLALAALVLGLPTFLMGGTLPAAVRAVEGTADVARSGELDIRPDGANTVFNFGNYIADQAEWGQGFDNSKNKSNGTINLNPVPAAPTQRPILVN